MSDPTRSLPPAWAARFTVLLDALGHVPMSYRERASLAVLAGQEPATVEHLAALIHRSRRAALRRALPGVLVALLAAAGLGCLAVAVVQLVTTVGPVVLVLAGAGLVAGLLRTAPLVPVLLCVAALVISPWLLLGVLALVGRREAGERR
jgi:hypothetical protein